MPAENLPSVIRYEIAYYCVTGRKRKAMQAVVPLPDDAPTEARTHDTDERAKARALAWIAANNARNGTVRVYARTWERRRHADGIVIETTVIFGGLALVQEVTLA